MLYLKLKGSPRERGQAHGEHFREKILEMGAIRRNLFETYFKGFEESEKSKLLARQLSVLKKSHSSLYEEFKAIAHASHLSEEDLLILNNYTDLRDFSFRPDQNSVRLDDGGCSVFSVRGKDSHIAGQTWDMDLSALPYIVHLSIDDHGGECASEILSVTGCVGLSGVNAHGVAVFINNLHSQEGSDGLVWPVLVREMLWSKSAAEALEVMRQNMPSSGHNYLICDPNEAINVEATGKRLAVTDRSKSPGFTFHTNHYLSELKNTEIKDRRSPTTDRRFQTLQSTFSKMKFDGIDSQTLAEGVFCGKTGEVISLELPKGPVPSNHTITCGGLILDMKKRQGEIFGGTYSSGDRRAITW